MGWELATNAEINNQSMKPFLFALKVRVIFYTLWIPEKKSNIGGDFKAKIYAY